MGNTQGLGPEETGRASLCAVRFLRKQCEKFKKEDGGVFAFIKRAGHGEETAGARPKQLGIWRLERKEKMVPEHSENEGDEYEDDDMSEAIGGGGVDCGRRFVDHICNSIGPILMLTRKSELD